MRINPEYDGASIVLIGAFNPRIFRPEWFANVGALGSKEAAAAAVEIIHPDITIFSIEWLQMRVEQSRFQAATADPPLLRIHDLVLNIFKEYLTHTPIYQAGINRSVHFPIGSSDERDRIGGLLAPKQPWGEWGPKLSGQNERRGGLTSLTMSQTMREDGYRGRITARIEPSQKLPIDGIFMEINDHYDLGTAEEIVGADRLVDLLEKEKQWDSSMERAEWIIDQIMALRGGDGKR